MFRIDTEAEGAIMDESISFAKHGQEWLKIMMIIVLLMGQQRLWQKNKQNAMKTDNISDRSNANC